MVESVKRELVGICKQSIVKLRHQLRQYVHEVHGQSAVDDLNPLILTAANEVSNNIFFSR